MEARSWDDGPYNNEVYSPRTPFESSRGATGAAPSLSARAAMVKTADFEGGTSFTQERGLLDTVVGVPSSRMSMRLLRAVPRTVRGRALACGLRPDCNAVTVAAHSPGEKMRITRTTTVQEQDTSDGEQHKRDRKQHYNSITSSGSNKHLRKGYDSMAE